MIYTLNQPNMLEGISGDFLALKYVTKDGPLIVAVEKSAIRFSPPGSAPENENEWAVVTESIWEQLKPHIADLAREFDIVRSTENVSWHHLDLTTELLNSHGIGLDTQAHWMQRNSSFQRD